MTFCKLFQNVTVKAALKVITDDTHTAVSTARAKKVSISARSSFVRRACSPVQIFDVRI